VPRPALEGVVRFKGKVPIAKTIDKSSDPACKGTSRSEEIVVSKGGLEGVHVRIKSGTAGKHTPSIRPVVIQQKGCIYEPRVIGAMAGQKLIIKNGDKTMHNVHAYVDGDTWFNRSQPKGAKDIVEDDLGEAGEVFELKCDVHRWMRAFVPLTDHPFFDVTEAEGRFRIEGISSGTYTLEAWHPKLGLKSKTVKVGNDRSPVVFEFP